MFGSKDRRIADLEARNAILVHQVADLRETANAWEWAAHREGALVAQQDRQRRIARAGVQRALATANTRTARYRTAWQSARQRAEAYGEGILRHVAERDDYHNWLHQEQAATAALRKRLAKSEQGRRNLIGLLEHHRDMGSLGLLRQHRNRLERALRACARYRAEIAALAALEPAEIQTCRTCGAGYRLGGTCSTCEYRALIAEAS